MSMALAGDLDYDQPTRRYAMPRLCQIHISDAQHAQLEQLGAAAGVSAEQWLEQKLAMLLDLAKLDADDPDDWRESDRRWADYQATGAAVDHDQVVRDAKARWGWA
jgi:hypothetical protein